jgi:tetratricopeptide (TPR) repeat protein
MKSRRNFLYILPLILATNVLAQMPSHALSDDQQLVEQARECIEKKELRKALYYIDCAQKLNPRNRTIYYNRGRIFNKQEKYKEAFDQFTKAIGLDPNYTSAIKRRGVVCIELRQYKEALADFDHALSIDPADPEPYAGRTRAYCDLGENKLALKNVDELIKLAPDRANYVVRARIKMNLRDHKGAIADCTRAAASNKRDDEAYLLRAQCHEALGNYKSALADYSHMLDFNKKDEMAYLKRGDVHLKLGEADKAVADYTNAIKYSPEANASMYLARAIAYRKANRIDLAKVDETVAGKISRGQ